MILKNAFIAVTRMKQDGKLYKDSDGAMYLVDHDHEALAGKEFCNTQESIQAVADYNEKSKEPFKGEIILLNVIEVS